MANAGLTTLRWRTQSTPSARTRPFPRSATTEAFGLSLGKKLNLVSTCFAISGSLRKTVGCVPIQYRNVPPGRRRR